MKNIVIKISINTKEFKYLVLIENIIPEYLPNQLLVFLNNFCCITKKFKTRLFIYILKDIVNQKFIITISVQHIILFYFFIKDFYLKYFHLMLNNILNEI